MVRKLIVIFLAGALCLLGITPVLAQKVYSTLDEYEKLTGNKIEKFNEAPMFRTKVAAGELPPVEERLPEEPLVVEPQSIGKYGGTLVSSMTWANCWNIPGKANLEPWLRKSARQPHEITPNLAKDWKLSKDAKTFTLYLRKGVKWSDGYPFTADDILFWYNDYLLNKELCPTIPGIWRQGGEVMKVEKVDDYTVRFKFAVSWPGVVDAFSHPFWLSIQGPTDGCYVPAHYLKKFHIKYNPDADKLAKEEGFDHWYQLFQNKATYGRDYEAEGLPVLGAWVVKVIAPDHVTLTRNPYYWKIDTEGNQLPYIDEVKGILADNPEMRTAQILSGQVDVFGEYGTVEIKQLPVVKKNAEKNNYEIYLPSWSSMGGFPLEITILPNHTVEDPFIRKLFNDVRFKKALSLAINREEVNEYIFLGTAKPRQIGPAPTSIYYDEKVAKAYTQYDPEKAKALLDEIGLKRDKEGYILRPDGKRLILVMEIAPTFKTHLSFAELAKEYWDKIGIKLVIHQGGGGSMWELFGANKSQLSLWVFDFSDEEAMILPPWWGTCYFWAQKWNLWLSTDGRSGTEPPAEVKEFANIWKRIPYVVDEKERIKMGKRAFEMAVENLWMIGVVGDTKLICGYRASLKNTNKVRRLCEWKAFQWFFEK